MLRLVRALAVISPLTMFAACGAGDVSPPPAIGGSPTDGGSPADGGDGSCVKQSAPSASSGCDPTKEDLYTCTGSGQPSGRCHASAQTGSYCCAIPAAGSVSEKGKIIDLSTKAAVPSAKITAGDVSATADAKGAYQLALDPTKKFNFKFEAPSYYTLWDQEAQVKAPVDLGKTVLLSESYAAVLIASLRGYDETLGVLSVLVEKMDTCADIGGATLEYTVDGQPPQAPTTMYYVQGAVPSASATSVDNTAFPQAVIFNATPGAAVAVTVKHPTCTMVPFPVDKDMSKDPRAGGSGTITYTSPSMVTYAGKNTSAIHVFLK